VRRASLFRTLETDFRGTERQFISIHGRYARSRGQREIRMDYLIRALIEKLVEKGVELTRIPPFIRVLARAISVDPFMSLDELNGQIRSMGYYDLELDEYTLQLVMILLTDSLNNSAPGERLWFEYGYNSSKVIKIDAGKRR
jgi:hypothetical protein